MRKTVGIFEVEVWSPYPCHCIIRNTRGGSIKFEHRDLADLKHGVNEMEKAAKRLLPDEDKLEV